MSDVVSAAVAQYLACLRHLAAAERRIEETLDFKNHSPDDDCVRLNEGE